jgi:hypothetical protein
MEEVIARATVRGKFTFNGITINEYLLGTKLMYAATEIAPLLGVKNHTTFTKFYTPKEKTKCLIEGDYRGKQVIMLTQRGLSLMVRTAKSCTEVRFDDLQLALHNSTQSFNSSTEVESTSSKSIQGKMEDASSEDELDTPAMNDSNTTTTASAQKSDSTTASNTTTSALTSASTDITLNTNKQLEAMMQMVTTNMKLEMMTAMRESQIQAETRDAQMLAEIKELQLVSVNTRQLQMLMVQRQKVAIAIDEQNWKILGNVHATTKSNSNKKITKKDINTNIDTEDADIDSDVSCMNKPTRDIIADQYIARLLERESMNDLAPWNVLRSSKLAGTKYYEGIFMKIKVHEYDKTYFDAALVCRNNNCDIADWLALVTTQDNIQLLADHFAISRDVIIVPRCDADRDRQFMHYMLFHSLILWEPLSELIISGLIK